MVHRSEVINQKQSVLIVSKGHKSFVTLLKNEFKKYDYDVYISPTLPESADTYHLCFFIDEERATRITNRKSIIIYIDSKKPHVTHLTGKSVHIKGDPSSPDVIDKLLWFSLSQSKEKFLTIISNKARVARNQTNDRTFYLPSFSKKQLFVMGLALLLVIHTIFIVPLSFSSLFLYHGAANLKAGDLKKSYDNYQLSLPFLKLAKTLYSPVRPTYLFFSLALLPDNVIEINDKTGYLLQLTANLKNEGTKIVSLIAKQDKSAEEVGILEKEIKQFGELLTNIHDTTLTLIQKLPNFPKQMILVKTDLKTQAEIIDDVRQFIDVSPDLMGKDTEKKYLILFANNMELRPGGGFIGSFAIITLKSFSVKNFQIYDVYDADGQLIAHVDPPDPIRDYLHQPHYFLRDSAFSPDFLDNFAKAKFFLEKESLPSDFNGGLLFTTTAVQNILSGFGDLYLPDYDETVNQKNFYLKAQIHSEKEFFPGSTQKKSFLSALTRQIILNLDRVPLTALTNSVKQSFDEKQIVGYVDSPLIQEKIFDSKYWSGRMIDPQCSAPQAGTPCTVDYIFPVDANLGVNKANFYVRRQMNLKTNIDVNGTIEHTFSMNIRNDSLGEVFPGGTYKNYFQLFLPKNSAIKNVTKNDVLVDGYNESNDLYKILGFYFEVKPQSMVNIKVTYSLKDKIPRGRNLYQLIFQKQIGSTNNDLSLQFDFYKNLYLLNQNFSPLVKDNTILYNTNLTADKIFLLELTKD